MKRIILINILLFITLVFTAILWLRHSTSSQKEIVHTLHYHPFTVSKSVLQINANIVSMHRHMKDVVLSTGPKELQVAIDEVANYERKIFNHFDIILDRFLGDKNTIIAARKAFVDWKPIRLEVIRYIKNNEREKAALITKGKGAKHVELLHVHLNAMYLYANSKANSLYEQSISKQKNSNIFLIVLIIAISLLVTVIAIYVTKTVRSYETMIKISENRFQSLVESTSDWIWEIDLEGNFLYASPGVQKILGYTPQDLIGVKTAFDILKEDNTEKIKKEFSEFVKTEVSFDGMVNINCHKDGRDVVLESSGQPFFDRNGKLLGYRGIDRDITERQRMAEELEESNIEKSRFLAHMSHEIRTPLNSILGMIELVGNTQLSNEQRDFIINANRSGNVLLNLINDILDMSKIEAGQLDLEIELMDVDQVVKESIEMLQVQASKKGLKLIIDSTIKDIDFYGDANRIRQILINIISNAIKFTDEGHVAISCKFKNNSAYITVSDTGMGVPEENQESIFTPFKQASFSITRTHGGTGLGLAICRQLACAMNGEIFLESSTGKGSTFQVIIPSAKSDDVLGPKECNAEENEDKYKDVQIAPMSILLADDSEANQVLVQAFLKKEPINLTIASDGEEALEVYKANTFDLVFMDIEMPVMDGFTASKKIREWERINNKAETPIIALTAHALKDILHETKESGINSCLFKPLSQKAILTFLKERTLLAKK